MDADITIIGAGVIGCAVAAELARPGRSVLVLERHSGIGRETSSRNSEVIHAGLYYPKGSLMARLCVEGKERLYRLCAEEGIAHARLGKIVVAVNSEQEALLEALGKKAEGNGVNDLQWLDTAAVRALEPHVTATAAFLSPSTGIIEGWELMAHLQKRAQARGAEFVFHTQCIAVERDGDGWRVTSRDATGEIFSHTTRIFVNAAGLGCDDVAAMCGIDVDAAGYRLHWCKGDYFSLPQSKARLVSRLVYPVKDPKSPGLGVHVTLDLSGRARLGPDAHYVDRNQVDWRVDPAKAREFYEATRKFLPFVEPDDLQPEMSGMRPKLTPPGTPQRDFVIAHEAARGLPGIVSLMGIESPGLTSSLALAVYVRRLLQSDGVLAGEPE